MIMIIAIRIMPIIIRVILLVIKPSRTLGRWKARVVHFPDIDRLQNPPSYMPRSVPKDIAERLMNVQGDPNTWWIGQFFKYTMKMNAAFQKYTEKLSLRLGFQRPIVG